ncbi:MAG: monofunctional biosynthetic peptidoglycan transglycosylase [Proteobacteria bacterium]|nr:monofunctional biosynthetic peptidoglycan transglycosylase [Pseudomonadota bacterium]
MGDGFLKKAKKPWLRIILIWILTIFFAYQIWILAHVIWWVNHNPRMSAFMKEGLDALQLHHPHARIYQQWVPYSALSINLKRAVIASEDETFARNDGFDFRAIEAAYHEDIRRGRIVAGGSTITQQLAKNLLLSKSRTPWRKFQEGIITIELNTLMTKKRILDLYLNVIQWGNGIYGAEAATRHYFGVHASVLSPYQAARLAAMIPDPGFYDLHRNDPWLAWKTNLILSRMDAMRVP